jgi:hypothetical protein
MIEAGYAPIVDAGNGTTTTFSIPWPIRSPVDVDVVLLDVNNVPIAPPPVLNGGGQYDYVVTGTPDPDTGYMYTANVVFNTAPPASMSVWRGRSTDNEQDKVLPSNGRFPAKSVESALDRRTLVSQELEVQVEQCIHVGPYDPPPAAIPPAATRANTYWANDASGNLIFVPPSQGSTPPFVLYPRTSFEIAAGVVPTNLFQPPGNIMRYGGDASGANDNAPAMSSAWAQLSAGGSPITFPPGKFAFKSPVVMNVVNVTNSFGQSGVIVGSGMFNTFIDNQVANGVMWAFGVAANLTWGFGSEIRDLQIGTTTSPANSSAVQFKAQYAGVVRKVFIYGMSAHGIILPEVLGDPDANNYLSFEECVILNCAGWGVNGIPSANNNQNGFLRIVACWIQGCGTLMPTATISSITNANPAVVTTAAPHGYANGQLVLQYGCTYGAVGADWANGIFVVAGATSTTYQMSGVNSTGLVAYTGASGLARASDPTSGGIGLCADTVEMSSCGFTLNKNVAFATTNISGSRGYFLYNNDFENNGPVQVHLSRVDTVRLINNEFLNSVANPATFGLILEGINNLVRDVIVEQSFVRASPTSPNSPHIAFYQVGGNVENSGVRVRATSWNNYDYALQSRFVGPWQFDPVRMACTLSWAGPAYLVLSPTKPSQGNSMPGRLSGGVGGTPSKTGEWISYQVPASGFLVSNAGLVASTMYYVYLYDNNGVATMLCSATGYVTDAVSGYPVKSDDATKLLVGTWATDASINFVQNRSFLCVDPGAGPGSRDYIFDCSVATFGTVAAGGGANRMPIVTDGAVWRVG